MKMLSYDDTYGTADLAACMQYMSEDNTDQVRRLKRNLSRALKQDITPRQREYMMLYYGENMSMPAIAARCGVHKSTVSRTLKRGREKLYRCLRYGAAGLLEEQGETDW